MSRSRHTTSIRRQNLHSYLKHQSQQPKQPIATQIIAGLMASSSNIHHPTLNSRADFEQNQLKVSSLQTKHHLSVTYPEIRRVPGDAKLELLDIANVSQRYFPQPLIPSKAVTINSGWESEQLDPGHALLQTVEKIDDDTFEILSANTSTSGMAHLSASLRMASKFRGTTVLHAVTFRYDDVKKPGIQILVRRKTAFIGRDPEAGSKHTFSLDDFEAVRAEPVQPDWWHLLDDLIYRRTDLAARVVSKALASVRPFEIEDTKADHFKPPRQINYDFVMQAISQADVASSPEIECIICREVAEDAVKLTCKQHYYCRACLTDWFNARGPASADCPLCRRKVVESPEQAYNLMLGLTDGIFYDDPRYNAYENFERSCADLDSRLPENITADVEWSGHTLFAGWNILVAGAALEGKESRPLHCQPVRVPEFHRISCEIKNVLMLAGAPSHAKGEPVVLRRKVPMNLAPIIIQAYIRKSLKREAFEIACAQTGMPYDPASMDKVEISKYLRLGFSDFLRRTVNRLLMMSLLRNCHEHPGSGWHRHGDRDYYGGLAE